MRIEKENSGVLFFNNYKKSDKEPDYRGFANIDGEQKEISAWEREFNGDSGFSLSIKEPYVKQNTRSAGEKKGSKGGLKPKPRPRAGNKAKVQNDEEDIY